MSIDIDFKGVENLERRLNEMSDTAVLKESLAAATLLVERSAKQKAPKDTGALRRSIASKVKGLEGIVYTPLEYAPYVEYGTGLFAENGNGRGTGGQKPQPYMRPSLDENRQKIVDILKEGVMKDG